MEVKFSIYLNGRVFEIVIEQFGAKTTKNRLRNKNVSGL